MGNEPKEVKSLFAALSCAPKGALACLMLLTCPAAALSASDKLIMECSGNVYVIGEMRSDNRNEAIAAHIISGTISLSGNSFLGGRDILICPAGTFGLADDVLFFDTSGCDTTAKEEVRTYGTYNKILRNLNVSHSEIAWVVSGQFKCKIVE